MNKWFTLTLTFLSENIVVVLACGVPGTFPFTAVPWPFFIFVALLNGFLGGNFSSYNSFTESTNIVIRLIIRKIIMYSNHISQIIPI